jgi:hypothetical protein
MFPIRSPQHPNPHVLGDARCGSGEDDLFGGPDNDTILAADGQVDYVNCGLGDNDTAYVDVIDEVDPAQAASCENLFEAQEQ